MHGICQDEPQGQVHPALHKQIYVKPNVPVPVVPGICQHLPACGERRKLDGGSGDEYNIRQLCVKHQRHWRSEA